MRYVSLVVRLCGASAAIAAVLHAGADPPKPDSGRFTLLLQNKPVGSDQFRLLSDGCDSDVAAALGNGKTFEFHQTLTYKKGRWTQLATNAGALGTMSLTIAGDKSILKTGDKPAAAQKLPATVFPYGDRSPHLLAFLVAAYDSKKAGEQKFDLIYSEGLGPGGVVLLTAKVTEPQTSERQLSGKTASIVRYSITLATKAGPVAMEVLTDKDRHVLYWSVPTQHYTAVRNGFEDLAR